MRKVGDIAAERAVLVGPEGWQIERPRIIKVVHSIIEAQNESIFETQRVSRSAVQIIERALGLRRDLKPSATRSSGAAGITVIVSHSVAQRALVGTPSGKHEGAF